MRLLLLTALLVLSACNGLFYQPDATIYATPDKVGVSYSEQAWTTADHETLKAWELRPITTPARATILHFHGNAQNRTAHFFLCIG